jgi:membrane peptidoglycan carboxypeptidase
MLLHRRPPQLPLLHGGVLRQGARLRAQHARTYDRMMDSAQQHHPHRPEPWITPPVVAPIKAGMQGCRDAGTQGCRDAGRTTRASADSKTSSAPPPPPPACAAASLGRSAHTRRHMASSSAYQPYHAHSTQQVVIRSGWQTVGALRAADILPHSTVQSRAVGGGQWTPRTGVVVVVVVVAAV